jgi:hypothetical protein
VPAVLPATGTKEDAVNQIVDLIRDIENTFKASGIKLLDNAGSGSAQAREAPHPREP